MIHPIPSGTRDVLPQETGEVRLITDTLRRVFDEHGYGEIYTPALEYESVLARADMAEALAVLCSSLEAVGLKDFRIGVGDASLFPALMESLQVPQDHRDGLLQALVRRNFVELEHLLDQAGVSGEAAELLLDVPQRRGGPELLTDAPAPAVEAVTGMRRVYELLDPSVAARVIFDLGLIRNIGYYTGAVFEVYDPAIGAPIGGGGRYDELLGRFGRSLPAVGFALYVDSLHQALAGEERGTGALSELRTVAAAGESR